MEFNNLLDLIIKAYLVVIVLSCFFRLFRGKVFVINGLSIMLNMYFISMLIFLPIIYAYAMEGKGTGHLVITSFLIIILTLTIIIQYSKMQRQTLFLGISDISFVTILRNVLSDNQIEYEENIDEFTVSINSKETFIHKPFIIGAGVYFIQSGVSDPKGKPSTILPLIMNTARASTLNWGGRILLCMLISYSIFMLLIL